MAMERFTMTRRSFKPAISIRANGQLGFSKGAMFHYNVGDYKFGILFFDPERKIMGIKLTNDEQEEGVIRVVKRKYDASMSIKSFLDYYDIKVEKTVRLPSRYDEKEGMIVVDMSKLLNKR